jgi:hypothetical protein
MCGGGVQSDPKTVAWTGGEPPYAIQTWRFLRLAMVAIVVGLGVSVLFELTKAPGCMQTSISAYYYTPVHAYFVGALVSVGVCMFCLRGNTEFEDVVLNLAGMLALIVALVPTPDPGSCMSVPVATQDPRANVANNVTALLAVGALALLFLAWLAAHEHRSRPADRPSPTELIVYVAAAAIWVLTALVFWLARNFFVGHAHYAAAVLMFGCILAAVGDNAFAFKRSTNGSSVRNRYTLIGCLMIGSFAVIGIAGLSGWKYWVIAIETALIGLFAVFWVIQTKELWEPGLREDPRRGGQPA